MLEIIKTITKKEWYFVIFIAIILIVVTTAPYIYSYVMTPNNFYYSGTNWTGNGDMYVYYSMIDQAREGHLLFENKFTSEPQNSALFQPLWLVMGVVAGLFHLSNFVIWHLARIFLTVVLMFVGYLFIAYFFPDRLKRGIALVLFAFSSGINTVYAESTVFTSVFHSPLLILSLILLILTFLFILLALERKSK
jgi:hypothetical protein